MEKLILTALLAVLLLAPQASLHAEREQQFLNGKPFNYLDGSIGERDLTEELCDLYQILFDRSLIGAGAIPEVCPQPPIYDVGDTGPAGGIVFYVTFDGSHGLEAAPKDQGDAQWGCAGTTITGADGTDINTGAQNTLEILAGCTTSGIAAYLASGDIMSNGFSDWFLPSKDELIELYLLHSLLGKGDFTYPIYWSSSQSSENFAWAHNFGTGSPAPAQGSKNQSYGVRAVRAF